MSQQIWNFLKQNGFNNYASAGIIGNLFAESNLSPINLQDSYQNKLGMNDKEYTENTDNGSYNNFIYDQAGYGLAQWTYSTRKRDLYNFLKKQGKSIGDLDGQLQYLLKEIKVMPSLYSKLQNAQSVKEASDAFMVQFENPADKSEQAKTKRANYGLKYYNQYANGDNIQVVNSSMKLLKFGAKGQEVLELQNALLEFGYDLGIDGADGDFGNATLQAVIQFQNDNQLEPDGEVGDMTWERINLIKEHPEAIVVKNVSTDLTADKLIAIAKQEIGYCEKNNSSNLDSKTAGKGNQNYTKYARDLATKGYYNGNKQGAAWCDMFVDWCFLQLCGGNATKAQAIECQTGPLGAGCAYSAQYYKSQSRWSATPQAGAQIFFYYDGDINHTGIVSAIKGNTVYTIEGNSSDCVSEHQYQIGDSRIAGYGIPKYESGTKHVISINTNAINNVQPQSQAQNAFSPYNIKVNVALLNVRSESNKKSKITSVLTRGITGTIIEEQNGFGKLSSGLGWVMLQYVEKI